MLNLGGKLLRDLDKNRHNDEKYSSAPKYEKKIKHMQARGFHTFLVNINQRGWSRKTREKIACYILKPQSPQIPAVFTAEPLLCPFQGNPYNTRMKKKMEKKLQKNM